MITGNAGGNPSKGPRGCTTESGDDSLRGAVPTFLLMAECGTCGEHVRVVVVHEHTFRKRFHTWTVCVRCWVKEQDE